MSKKNKKRRNKLFALATDIEELSEADVEEINKILGIWKSDIRISKTVDSKIKLFINKAKKEWDEL